MTAGKTIFLLVAAFIIDCVVGDPQNPYHPIRLVGHAISFGVSLYKKAKIKSASSQFAAGMLLTLSVVCVSYAATLIVILALYKIHFLVGLASEAIICYFLIAPKALRDESMKVYRSLLASDTEGAKRNLSFIVGRDVENLDIPGIIRAAVETVAENVSDGVIAPLMFICIGGAPLGMAYKAINTLDSMIGYKNEEYMHFGKFAARLDDIVNFIPSRISALLMIFGCIFVNADIKGAARVYAKDRYKHKSPNSGQTESVCAGALGIRLGGDNYYGGALVSKPEIGDGAREPAPGDIVGANRLMYAATSLAVVLFSASGLIFRR